MRIRTLLIGSAVLTAVCLLPTSEAAALPTMSIAVSGDHLVDQNGTPVVLRGADTSGTEYACVSENSIFDGTQEASPSSIAAMRSWGFNAARVELNESCWLGVQGVKPAYSGQAYQQAIEQYVAALNAAGMFVIVDMHFSSTGGTKKGQGPAPDARRTLRPGLLDVGGHGFQGQSGGHLRLVQ